MIFERACDDAAAIELLDVPFTKSNRDFATCIDVQKEGLL